MGAWLRAVVVIGAVSLVACDDDDTVAAGSGDAGEPDAAEATMDAAEEPDPVAPGVKIENAGASCDSDQDCVGPQSFCYDMFEFPQPPAGAGGPPPGAVPDGGAMLPTGIDLPGGYCSAACESNEECGPRAACAGLDLIETIQGILEAMGQSFPIDPAMFGFELQCAARCESQAGCREGYTCQAITDLIPMGGPGGPGGIAGFLPPGQDFCLPTQAITPPGDGGTIAPMDGGTMNNPDNDAGNGADAG